MSYDKTVLLLPMFGPNAGTSFPDFGVKNRNVSALGDVKTVTAQSKYYGSSAYFDGTGDYLSVPDPDNVLLAGPSFTIQCWARLGAASGMIANKEAGGVRSILFATNVSRHLVLSYHDATDTLRIHNSETAVALDTWVHLEAGAADGTIRLFIDGQSVLQQTFYAAKAAPAAPLLIGSLTATSFMTGHLQDFRFVAGECLHTSNFTPPPRLVGAISGTITDQSGDPVARKVVAIPRDAPLRTFGPVDSDPGTGAYEIWVPNTECSRIVLAGDDPLYNDIIDRVIPA